MKMDTEIRPYISWRPAVKCRYRVDLWRRPPREVHTSLEDEEELLQLLEDPRRLGIGRQS